MPNNRLLLSIIINVKQAEMPFKSDKKVQKSRKDISGFLFFKVKG